MRGLFILALGFLVAHTAGCQPSDQAMVRFDELSYNSYFEQLAFLDLESGKKNYLKLLMSVDPSINTTKYNITCREIEIELQRMNKRKFLKAKPEKKIEYIYDDVNLNILKEYKEDVFFPRIFNTGEFNCLTATAYYGIIMDSLGIPYEFRETYNHVHPVAYPRQQQVFIETTDPVAGINYFDEKLKVRFVNYLLETSRISRSDYDTISIDRLFNRYYLPEKSIGMKELTGLQYMNDALYKFSSGEYAGAFEQIKKAWFLYPSQKMLAVFQFILNGTLLESDFKKLSDVRFIVYQSRLIGENLISSETVSNTFQFMSNIVLINRSDVRLYDSIFNYLMVNLKEQGLKNDISFQYYQLRGKSLLGEYKLKDALDLFEKAYEINPGNLEVQTLLVTTFAYTFQNSSNRETVQRIGDMSAKFPSLDSNGLFMTLKMTAYLSYVEELFDFGEPDRALEYLAKFESTYKTNGDIELNYKVVGDAYSAAAVYFFKKYNKKKAKEYLEKGLEIAPDNFELRYRLNSL